MPSFIEIEARKAQREAEHIRLQQEEEADLREQERLEKGGEERLAKEAEEARLEEVRRQEEAREVVQRRRAQKEAEARARAEEVSSDEVGSVSGTIHIRRKRVMAAGELDMSRKVVGMDGSEWFPKIGVSCLRCKKRGEVCYWPLESKRPDGTCHRCKWMKLACRVEEESQSEVPMKKAQVAKGKGKAGAMSTVAEDQIPGLVAFFGRVDESLRLLVEEGRHTNALLFNLGADIAENTKLVGDVKNLLFKICRRGSDGGVAWRVRGRGRRVGEDTDAGVVAEDRWFGDGGEDPRAGGHPRVVDFAIHNILFYLVIVK